MPRRIPYQLQWSKSLLAYAVFFDGQHIIPSIEPANELWLPWLEAISSFSFESRFGASCTVRKEAVQRGDMYWYAYRRGNGRMMKRYLARTADLTPARLEEVANILNEANALPEPDYSAITAMQIAPHTRAITGAAAISQSTERGTPPQQLLLTRLHLPHLPMQYVSRPRLLALLQQGAQGHLTLVSAPAGSGKTTLLAEWAATVDLPVAWISLDATDNDPARFLAYLLVALASLDQRISTAPPANTYQPEQALTAILNDLSRLLAQEAFVILDDYHLLTN
jgi:LuxR family transcriptional regulator, maltose regulon positive regulatory protein